MRAAVLSLIGAALLCACEPALEAPDPPAEPIGKLAERLQHEINLLRHVPYHDPKHSSRTALESAEMVFVPSQWLGRPRAEVLDALGDPLMVSPRGLRFEPASDPTLVYRLDQGEEGMQYVFRFAVDGRVAALDAQAIYGPGGKPINRFDWE